MELVTILAASAGALSLVGLLAGLHYLFWVRRLRVELDYHERFERRAADGLPYTLLRLPPPAAPREAPPVLLVHGIAANHRNIDAEADISLARYLAAEGRDVWLLALRSGDARLRWRERRRADFRSMLEHDLPEAVEFVLAQTKAPALDYVGFSMGGILLYGALGRSLEPERLRKVVTIGSPARVAPPLAGLRRLRRVVPRALLRVSGLRLGARMLAFAAEWFDTPIHRQIYNPANVARGVAQRAMVNMIHDIPPPLSADFASWALADGVVRVGEEDVLAHVGELELPARFFAGVADPIAPPASVRAAYEAWGAKREQVDKQLVLMGRAHGCEQDYGHGDLAIGERAARELFVRVAEFLGSPTERAEPLARAPKTS